MAPPPATPNPHRFSTSKQPPPSRAQTHPTPQSQSSQQFASTPRFSFSLAKKQTPSSSSAAQRSTHFSSPLRLRNRPAQRRSEDDIEDTPAAEEEELHTDVNLTSSGYPYPTKRIEGIDSPPTSSSSPIRKRPRIHPPDFESISISSSPSPSPSPSPRTSPPPPPPTSLDQHPPHPSSSPQPPLPPTNNNNNNNQNRFILSPLPTTQPPTSNILHPQFSLPPRSPSPPHATTLAKILFSPARKGGPKFLAGGMASLVRGWVCDVAATTNVARGREKSGGDGEGWERRVKARDVMGDGGRAVLVEGEEGEGNGEGERWMLVGNGGGNVRKGEVLGVRRPVWDVELEEGRWMVGVEWGVVDG